MNRTVKTALSIVLGASLCVLVAPLIRPDAISPYMRSDCLPGLEAIVVGDRSIEAWCPASDAATNAFFLWRTSPISSALRNVLSPETPLVAFEFSVGLLLIFLGIWCLQYNTEPKCRNGVGAPYQSTLTSDLLRTLIAVFGSLSCASLTGSDRVSLAALSWFPLLISCVVLAQSAMCQSHVASEEESTSTDRPCSTSSALALGALFLCSTFLALSANQLGLVLAIAALLFAKSVASTETNHQCGSKGMLYVALITLVPPLLLLATIPQTPMPWYPQGVQVVPDDEIPGMLRPFFGPLPPVPFIDRWAVKELYIPGFHVVLIALFALLILARRSRTAQRQALLVAGAPIALLFIDLRLPESISIISPLLVIPRVVPELFFIPIENTTIAVAALGILIAALSLKPSLALLNAPLIGVLSLILLPTPPMADKELPTLSNAAFSERHATLLRSPSQFVLRAHHWDALGKDRNWILEREALIESAEFSRISRDDAQITTSTHAGRAKFLIDDRPKTRWTSGGGRQRGDEWVGLRFSSPRQLDAVELFLGNFVTDFPRGLRVRASASCEAPPRAPGFEQNSEVLLNYPAWYGGLDFTPQGYPYFRGRYSMRLFFPKTEEIQCLLFEQTGESIGTDWSIAEVRILEHSIAQE